MTYSNELMHPCTSSLQHRCQKKGITMVTAEVGQASLQLVVQTGASNAGLRNAATTEPRERQRSRGASEKRSHSRSRSRGDA